MKNTLKPLLILPFLFAFSFCYSQLKNESLFYMVEMPDSIALKLDEAYSKNAENVNAGRNVFNLANRKNFVFGDGIYSFKGQGPHFPRRLFIFNNDKLFIFNNEGAFNPKGVMREFADCIDKLQLTNEQVVKYSKIISIYLEQEEGNTYGQEIK